MESKTVKAKDVYDEFVDAQIAELHRYQSNPELMGITKYKRTNCGEEAPDVAAWNRCIEESVRDHKDIIDEWARKV